MSKEQKRIKWPTPNEIMDELKSVREQIAEICPRGVPMPTDEVWAHLKIQEDVLARALPIAILYEGSAVASGADLWNAHADAIVKKGPEDVAKKKHRYLVYGMGPAPQSAPRTTNDVHSSYFDEDSDAVVVDLELLRVHAFGAWRDLT